MRDLDERKLEFDEPEAFYEGLDDGPVPIERYYVGTGIKLRMDWEIVNDMHEAENKEHIFNLIASQAYIDLVDLYFNGDTETNDRLLKSVDGLLKVARKVPRSEIEFDSLKHSVFCSLESPTYDGIPVENVSILADQLVLANPDTLAIGVSEVKIHREFRPMKDTWEYTAYLRYKPRFGDAVVIQL